MFDASASSELHAEPSTACAAEPAERFAAKGTSTMARLATGGQDPRGPVVWEATSHVPVSRTLELFNADDGADVRRRWHAPERAPAMPLAAQPTAYSWTRVDLSKDGGLSDPAQLLGPHQAHLQAYPPHTDGRRASLSMSPSPSPWVRPKLSHIHRHSLSMQMPTLQDNTSTHPAAPSDSLQDAPFSHPSALDIAHGMAFSMSGPALDIQPSLHSFVANKSGHGLLPTPTPAHARKSSLDSRRFTERGPQRPSQLSSSNSSSNLSDIAMSDDASTTISSLSSFSSQSAFGVSSSGFMPGVDIWGRQERSSPLSSQGTETSGSLRRRSDSDLPDLLSFNLDSLTLSSPANPLEAAALAPATSYATHRLVPTNLAGDYPDDQWSRLGRRPFTETPSPSLLLDSSSTQSSSFEDLDSSTRLPPFNNELYSSARAGPPVMSSGQAMNDLCGLCGVQAATALLGPCGHRVCNVCHRHEKHRSLRLYQSAVPLCPYCFHGMSTVSSTHTSRNLPPQLSRQGQTNVHRKQNGHQYLDQSYAIHRQRQYPQQHEQSYDTSDDGFSGAGQAINSWNGHVPSMRPQSGHPYYGIAHDAANKQTLTVHLDNSGATFYPVARPSQQRQQQQRYRPSQYQGVSTALGNFPQETQSEVTKGSLPLLTKHKFSQAYQPEYNSHPLVTNMGQHSHVAHSSHGRAVADGNPWQEMGVHDQSRAEDAQQSFLQQPQAHRQKWSARHQSAHNGPQQSRGNATTSISQLSLSILPDLPPNVPPLTPRTEAIKWAVIRVTNIPWDVSLLDMQAFFSGVPFPPEHLLSQNIHILMDRTTGKTFNSAYIELALTPQQAAIVAQSKNLKVLKGRLVTVELSNQDELMRSVFPKWAGDFAEGEPIIPGEQLGSIPAAKSQLLQGGNKGVMDHEQHGSTRDWNDVLGGALHVTPGLSPAYVGEIPKEMSTGVPGYDNGITVISSNGVMAPHTPPFVTRDEINAILVVCRNYKLHFSRKCAERPFENILTILAKYPWHQPYRVLPIHRDHIFELLKLSIESLRMHLNKEYNTIHPTLLLRMVRNAILIPSFTERQKSMVLHVAGCDCPEDLVPWITPPTPVELQRESPIPTSSHSQFEHGEMSQEQDAFADTEGADSRDSERQCGGIGMQAHSCTKDEHVRVLAVRNISRDGGLKQDAQTLEADSFKQTSNQKSHSRPLPESRAAQLQESTWRSEASQTGGMTLHDGAHNRSQTEVSGADHTYFSAYSERREASPQSTMQGFGYTRGSSPAASEDPRLTTTSSPSSQPKKTVLTMGHPSSHHKPGRSQNVTNFGSFSPSSTEDSSVRGVLPRNGASTNRLTRLPDHTQAWRELDTPTGQTGAQDETLTWPSDIDTSDYTFATHGSLHQSGMTQSLHSASMGSCPSRGSSPSSPSSTASAYLWTTMAKQPSTQDYTEASKGSMKAHTSESLLDAIKTITQSTPRLPKSTSFGPHCHLQQIQQQNQLHQQQQNQQCYSPQEATLVPKPFMSSSPSSAVLYSIPGAQGQAINTAPAFSGYIQPGQTRQATVLSTAARRERDSLGTEEW